MHKMTSRAGEDKKTFVTGLARRLKELGVKCFLDYDSRDALPAGTRVRSAAIMCCANLCCCPTRPCFALHVDESALLCCATLAHKHTHERAHA